jgi:hypothetical protein
MTERGERATGTPNTIYDLASVLYHTLDAGASYDQYVRDAEEANDRELAEFFRVLRDEDSRRADYAQELLAQRTPTGGARTEDVATRREGMTPGVPPSPEPAGSAPGAGYVPPVGPQQGEEVPPTRPGTEGPIMPPRREEVPPTEQEGERARRPEREREEDRGLLEEVRDRLLGHPEEQRRSEGTDRPDRR